MISDLNYTLHKGDALSELKRMPDNCCHACVTSPPYYKQRSNKNNNPFYLGNEKTIEEYLEKIVIIFREIRRVLREDGSAWINLGDKYDNNKSLYGVPFAVAESLKNDGWFWRNTHPWIKKNVLPDGAKDRAHNSMEYVLQMTTSSKNYYYDPESAKDQLSLKTRLWRNGDALLGLDTLVLDINTCPSKVPHLSMMPPELAKTMIRASTSDHGCDFETGIQYRRIVKKVRRSTRPGKS